MKSTHYAAMQIIATSCMFAVAAACLPAYAQEATSTPDAVAQDVSETAAIQAKIDARKDEIRDLEAAIEADKAEITRLSKVQRSLKDEIKMLDLTRSKLLKDISVTQNKIAITDASISSLGTDIAIKESARRNSSAALAGLIRSIDASDGLSFQESLLMEGSFSAVWEDSDMLDAVQAALSTHLTAIRTVKSELEARKREAEEKRTQLSQYRATLADQKAVVDYTSKEKNSVLSSAKNKESQYQALLADKLAKKEAFERELLSFETELRLITDPSALPPAKAGMLRWPMSSVRLTQDFGDTEFSRSWPGLYSGKGHNGIDLGAPIGTAILSAESGQVKAIGDTDAVCPGASYGKWVLIEHDFGLSTLYAHLSLIKVDAGQNVAAGETIGYVGMTGYTTGPHLHFTVYATQGVRVMDRKSKVCGGTYRMPVADLRAYLNPLLYTPAMQ